MPLTKVDASNIIDGVLPVANGGTGQTTFPSPGTAGNVLTSNGTAWTSATPASNAVSQSFPIASGKSVTLGKMVSLNSSGQVGDYPVINTLSSVVRENVIAQDYYALSNNGTRALYITAATLIDNGTYQVTFKGANINTTGNATNGGNTVTVTATTSPNGSHWFSDVMVKPLDNDKFFVLVVVATYPDGGTIGTRSAIIQVDASGNVTKGNEIALTTTTGNNTFNGAYGINYIYGTNTLLQFVRYSTVSSFYRVMSYSGTTITVLTNDGTEAENFSSFSGKYTPNTLLVNGGANIVTLYGTSVSVAPYSSNNIGTPVTTTTLVSDVANSGTFAYGLLSNSRAWVIYKRNDVKMVLNIYSINQTTGAFTLVDSRVVKEDASVIQWTNIVASVKSDTQFVISYTDGSPGYVRSVLLNANGTINGLNDQVLVANLTPTARLNSGDTYYVFYYESGNNKSRNYTVNAYATIPFVYLGAPTATTSSSPVSVVVNGIAGGFSGLVPGTKYYIDPATLDGSLTTSATGGAIYAGTATTATQLLLRA